MIEMRAAFADALLELGAENPSVIVFDADVGASTYTARFRDAYPRAVHPGGHCRAEHGRHGGRRQHARPDPLGIHVRRVPGQAGGRPGPRVGRLCAVERQAQRGLRGHPHRQGRRNAPIGRRHRRDALHAQHDRHLSRRSAGNTPGGSRGDRPSRAGLPADRPLPRAGHLRRVAPLRDRPLLSASRGNAT